MKILSYILTPIFFLFFGFTLLVFHVIQVVCFRVFGYQAHKQSVIILQFFLMRCLNILGTRFSISNPYNLPTDRPLIIVSNHQSMFDIPPIFWYFSKHHPKFISKIELSKGIPSISYNLKHGRNALVDRKNPIQSINSIKTFAKDIKDNNWSAVIFAEGTRSRTGHPKPFKRKGLLTLFEDIPNAMVVPLSINNSWKLYRYGKFPMGLGAHLKYTVHQPLLISEFKDHNQLIDTIEANVTNAIVV